MRATNEVISTDNPAAVTFDTLSAAQELREAGLDDRQAEAIVTTVSKAMSETVATKADLELQGAATRADIETLRTDTKANIGALRADTKANIEALRTDTKANIEALRTDTKANIEALRTDTKANIEALRAEVKLLAQSVDNRFEKMDLRFKALEQSIVIKLGALMVTMTFLLLALGPFYFRWVMSLMGAG
jgi:hypothetical protein